MTQGTAPAYGHHKMTVCHATGSATNPYVEISIPPPAVQAHSRHQDGRDIVPAPAEGCPGTAATAQSKVQAPAIAQQTADALSASLPARQGVLGARASGGAAVEPARLAAAKPAASRASDGPSLPFTGFVVAVAAALGVALLLAGVAIRRAVLLRRTRPSGA